MNFDWLHMLVTAVLIGAVILGLQRLDWYEAKPRGQKALIVGVMVFVVLIILNLIWPSGAGT